MHPLLGRLRDRVAALVLRDDELRRYRTLATQVLDARTSDPVRDARIDEAIRHVRATTFRSPRSEAGKLLVLADLERARLDYPESLARLIEAGRSAVPEVRAEAIRRMLDFSRFKRTLNRGKVGPSFFPVAYVAALRAILEPVAHAATREIVAAYICLEEHKTSDALRHALDAIHIDRGVRPYVAHVLETCAKRIASPADVAVLLDATRRHGLDPASAAYPDFLSIRAAHEHTHYAAAPGLHVGADEIARYLKDIGPLDLRGLIRNHALFNHSYRQADAVKAAILARTRAKTHYVYTSVFESEAFLRNAAMTSRFWTDPDFRDEAITATLRQSRLYLNETGHYLRGCAEFARGNVLEAARHFGRAIGRRNSIYERTGATSLFGDLDADDEIPETRPDFRFAAPRTDRQTLLCCADDRYFRRYAKRYVTSARRHGIANPVHFHISAESHDAARTAFLDTFGTAPSVTYSSEVSAIRTPAYFASMRFLHAPALLDRVSSQLVLTDIDVMFRQRADRLFAHTGAAACDIALRVYDTVREVGLRIPAGEQRLLRYPRILPWMCVNAACVAVNDTPAGRGAAARIAGDMHRHLGRAVKLGRRAWWVDQNSLLHSLRALGAVPDIRIVNVETSGVPFSHFDYTDAVEIGGRHPALPGLRFADATP